MATRSLSPTVQKVAGRIGFAVVLLLTAVALLSVVVRFALTTRVLIDGPAAAVPSNVFEDRYTARPWLTMTHVVAGFLFMVTGPLQFLPAIRNRWLRFHRATGRVFVVASLVAGGSALAMVPLLPVFGTFTAKVAATFGGLLFLACIGQAYYQIRRRAIRQHREWMIRAYALGLGIATFRVFLPILMSPLVRLPFAEAWDTVVWLGFTVNLLVAELWINLTRYAPPTGASSGDDDRKADRRLHRQSTAALDPS